MCGWVNLYIYIIMDDKQLYKSFNQLNTCMHFVILTKVFVTIVTSMKLMSALSYHKAKTI